MTQNGWKRTDYDERFEMLYSSIITQNSSWSQAAVSLTRSVCRWRSDSGLSSSSFQAPVPERSGRPSRSREAPSAHTQSTSLQKSTFEPWGWSEQDPGKYGRARSGPELQGQRGGRRWREMVPANGGSENSIVISDEGTDCEILEEGDGGRMTSSPIVDGDAGVHALWVLGDGDGFRDREHEARGQGHAISLPNNEREALEFGRVVGDPDNCSDSLSTASGPTLSADFALRLPCPACAKLFRKMRRLKDWEKIIDNDPTSLSCDQWVLKKIWRPRALPNRKGKLWTHLSQIRMRALSSTEAGEIQNPKPSCSRPHVFLHRNLLLCKRKDALARRKPRHARAMAVRAGARGGRRQKKRKLCETELQEEGQLHTHCASSSSTSRRAEEPALNISDSEDKTAACRKLQFHGASVAPDPKRQYEKPENQKTAQQDVEPHTGSTSLTPAATRSETFNPSPVGGALDPCPWVRGGGFRTMLVELEGNRSVVVRELDRLSANKLR
ncbi:hypothetical protein COCON_G00048350 [Conger conger]|uniref:Uncharacterized protein n=1 Tax=Conger conger TaxID=82655 RepID=A0A9Q1I5A3_CONCO|nr:hypothetical protein COCON_G00048350 [Conger conger]